MTDTSPTIAPTAPRSALARAIDCTLVATLATLMVQASAFLAAATFDHLPMFLDALLVMIFYPALLTFAVLMIDAKALTPLVPGWLRRVDGHQADHPSLLIVAFFLAAVMGIYPGMFAYRTFVHMKLDGAALDVPVSPSTRGDAAFYRFRDATLRADHGGGRSRKVIVRDGTVSKTILVTTHVAPIVETHWNPGMPVRFWATFEGDVPPWRGEVPLRGLHNYDERHHALRAVRSVAEDQGLTVADEPVLVTLGDPWEVELARSRFRSGIVLLPVAILVFVVTWLLTWKTLRYVHTT